MKFFHVADLHFGKTIYGTSLIDAQRDWIHKFIDLCRLEQVDAVAVAGDVYDRSAPSADAMRLLNDFISGIVELGIPLLMIAGNHDSGMRLLYGEDIFKKNQVHIAGLPQVPIQSVTITGKDGVKANFYMLPYTYPQAAKDVLGGGQDEENQVDIKDYETAVGMLIEASNINFDENNIMIAHQNVTSGGKKAQMGGSESLIGGLGRMDAGVFEGFDYVALGHIHAAYPVQGEHIRYAGSPMCYHFDEVRQAKKGPVLVEIGEHGMVGTPKVIELEPLNPLKYITGTLNEAKDMLMGENLQKAFVKVVITDQPMSPAISDSIRNIVGTKGGSLLEVSSSYLYTNTPNNEHMTAMNHRDKSVTELFVDFYKSRRSENDPTQEEMDGINEAADIVEGMSGEFEDNNPSERAVDRFYRFICEL